MPSDQPRLQDRAALTPEIEAARLRVELAAAEQRAKRLAAELPRYLNNALAIMRSVVRRTARGANSIEDYVMQLESRLSAIGRAQGLSFRALLSSGVALDAVLAEELLAHTAQEDGQVMLAGPAVMLQAGVAATLVLVINELALNSVVDGALSTPAGRIAIRWHTEPGDEAQPSILHLEWVESGGPPPAQGRQRGFGTEVVERMLEYELRATAATSIDAHGLRWTAVVPLIKAPELFGRP